MRERLFFNIPFGSNDHTKAREFADKQFRAFASPNFDRLAPGTYDYHQKVIEIINTPINEGGAKFVDNSSLYNFEFVSKLEKFVSRDLEFGGNYRLYDPNTNGTVFSDTLGNDLTMFEYGLFTSYSHPLNEKLTLNLDIRFDKNENYSGKLSPRFSMLFKTGESSNVRFSAISWV